MVKLGQKKRTKIIKRGKGIKQNMYFHEGTAAAISLYQKCADASEREKLYLSEIFPAFDKLVENLIFIHGFRGLHDSIDDLRNDCVTFLYEAIHKFDPTRGSKPFSYFNVVAKHWLIIRSKQRVGRLKKIISIDDILDAGQEPGTGGKRHRREHALIEEHNAVMSPDEQFELLEFVGRVHNVLQKIKQRASSDNELKCIDAIIRVFDIVNDTDEKPGEDLMLNKRSVFVYLRELSGLSAKTLTMTLAQIKRHYRDLRMGDDGIY